MKGARLNAARGEVSGQMLLLTNFRSLNDAEARSW